MHRIKIVAGCRRSKQQLLKQTNRKTSSVRVYKNIEPVNKFFIKNHNSGSKVLIFRIQKTSNPNQPWMIYLDSIFCKTVPVNSRPIIQLKKFPTVIFTTASLFLFIQDRRQLLFIFEYKTIYQVL